MTACLLSRNVWQSRNGTEALGHRFFMNVPACPRAEKQYVGAEVGLWRSLVARPSGGRKVAGSSPASPTNQTGTPPPLLAAGVSFGE